MAFASGPVSFQRFFITGKFHDDVTEALLRAVKQRSFGRISPAPDDTQTGWIGPRHVLDTEIDAETIAFGRFAHLAMRVDRLRAPASVVRAYTLLEQQAVRQATGRDFLSKGEQRKAREAAQTRLEQEVRAGGFRRMTMIPVLIDFAQRVVFLGNLSTAMADKFMLLFSDTFGAALEPADAPRVATRTMIAHRNARALEHLPAFHLVRPPDARTDSGSFQSELIFLGREFLTWLWFRADGEDHPLRVKDGDELTIAIERSLRLTCDFGLTGAVAISAETPASLPEARAALRTGKQPLKAGLVLGSPAGDFRLTLDGARLAVSGLQVPEDQRLEDWRARLEARFEGVTEVAALLDALFEQFLLMRTASAWAAELREITAWAAGQAGGRRPQVASA